MDLQSEINSLLDGKAILPDHTMFKFLIHFWSCANTTLHVIIHGKELSMEQYRCLAAIQYAGILPGYPAKKWIALMDEVDEWFHGTPLGKRAIENNEEPMFIPPQLEEDVLVPYIIVGINI